MGTPRSKKNSKQDLLQEALQGRVVGGTLSQLANYADLFQRMSEAVFLLDRHNFRVLECNPAAMELLGVNEEDILGRPLHEIFEETEVFQKPDRLASEAAFELEFHSSLKGHRVFEVSSRALKILDYIEVIQFIARDVTEVKAAQRELQEMNAVLQQLSTTDEMTGLKNYRYFKEALQAVHHQAKAFQKPYGVIFIDVDHFKKFNDRNGHPAGDQVLKLVAKILQESARGEDLAARYGGEEFVVLCRDCDAEETRVQAERIRSAIEATVFPFGEFQPLGRVTASIGVASFPLHAREAQDVLTHADEALYVSKQQGRNRVTLFDSSMAGVSSEKKTA